MYSRDELHVIRAVLSNAEFKGIKAAALIVALFHKTEILIEKAEAVVSGKPADTTASAESGVAEPTRESNRDGHDTDN